MRMGSSRLMSAAAGAFIWVFRSIPMLVQLLFWYNLAALFPTLSLGIPWGPRFVTFDANSLLGPLTAAVIGLTLHETAYVAELIRSGLLSVPEGQRQAAAALGLTPTQVFFRITLPQALRVIVPPMGNELISLLKATSLVSVISLAELFTGVRRSVSSARPDRARARCCAASITWRSRTTAWSWSTATSSATGCATPPCTS
jgi:polar amino acid transport system permease protein